MMGPRGLLEQETSKPRSTGTTVRRLAGYFKPYWLILIGVLFLMIFNAWTQVLTPVLTGQAVDCYLTPAKPGLTPDPRSSRINGSLCGRYRF